MSGNPRQCFMSSLGSLSRDLDTRVSDLEREVQVSALGRRDKEEGCEASMDLLREAKDLLGQMRDSTAEVAERRADLDSFLEDWRQQFKGIVAEAVKMEDFMSKYGFQPAQPIVPADWDWTHGMKQEEEEEEELVEEDLIATPAAAEFPPDAENTAAVTSKKEPIVSKLSEPPSVFDIGLSTLAMEIVAGRSLRRAEPSSVLPIIHAGPVSPLPVPTTQQSLMQDESLYAASPFLRCNSKLAPISDSSLSAVDMSSLEITPGLLTNKRNTISLRARQAEANVTPLSEKTVARVEKLETDLPTSRDTPEVPDLQTINLGRLIQQQRAVDSLSTNLPLRENPVNGDVTVMSPPIMNSEKMFSLRTDLDNRRVMDSPEIPDLKTVDVRRLLQESRVAGKIEVGGEGKENVPGEPCIGPTPLKTGQESTPELPEISSAAFRLSGSPVTPVLHYKYE